MHEDLDVKMHEMSHLISMNKAFVNLCKTNPKYETIRRQVRLFDNADPVTSFLNIASIMYQEYGLTDNIFSEIALPEGLSDDDVTSIMQKIISEVMSTCAAAAECLAGKDIHDQYIAECGFRITERGLEALGPIDKMAKQVIWSFWNTVLPNIKWSIAVKPGVLS